MTSDKQPRPGVLVPPDSLLEKWRQDYMNDPDAGAWAGSSTKYGAVKGAAWGADEQLRLCVEWLNDVDCDDPQEAACRMQAAMRPKPPSLKQQVLEAHARCSFGKPGDKDLIRRALEALPDDEGTL